MLTVLNFFIESERSQQSVIVDSIFALADQVEVLVILRRK